VTSTLERPRAAPVSRRALPSLALGCAILVFGLAAAVRLYLLVRSGWLLEGDDALSALMAFGVMDGDRPIMLKNQTYAAAYEPYAMAVTFSLLGISRVAAKLPELVNSLLFVGTTWLLAREAAGRTAAWFAAALAALPPVYVLVLSIKPWAPYTEVIVLGSLCLFAAMRLAWPRAAQSDARWALGCGVAGGLAFWMHPLAIWYLLAGALTLALGIRGRRWLGIAGTGLFGFVIGALPVWLYNVQTNGATLRFVLSGSSGQTADRWQVFQAWWNNDLPRGAGLWHPWGPSSEIAGWLMGVAVVAALIWAVFGREAPRPRPLDSILVLLIVIPTVFVLSGFGGPALNPYGFDATGRYAPPIWSALAVVLGAALGALWRVRHWLAAVLGIVPLAINAVALASITPLDGFQSPYWDRLPLDNAPLLQALKTEGIDAVWVNHWAGQPLMFDARAAGQTLVAYDWYDVQAGGIDRFPEYLPRVRSAARPAFVLVTDEAQPELELRLRQMGISFRELRVPPYVVVLPTSTRVDPSEVTPALDYRY
jgi:dolichyl-phosphate-mannose-protein mannosyltransferase